MECICRDRVERCEFPAGEYRLHYLVAQRDPIDTIQQIRLAHLRRRSLTNAKHDLRLDARLSERSYVLNRGGVELKGPAIGAVAPDGILDSICRPHLAIREAYLSTGDLFTASLEGGAEQCR